MAHGVGFEAVTFKDWIFAVLFFEAFWIFTFLGTDTEAFVG